MEAVALLLGMAAIVLALIGRAEQSKLKKQVERLRQIVHKAQLQAGPEVQPPKRSAQAVARTEAVVAPPKPSGTPAPERMVDPEELVEVRPGEDTPTAPIKPKQPPRHDVVKDPPAQPDKKETLQRLASSDKPAQVRPTHAPQRPGSAHAQPVSKSAPKPVVKPKAEPVSLEERLSHVGIWVGGVVLMLAGAFLIKYSFDNNLLRLETRLMIAGTFGALMVLSSLWLHSRADKVAAAVCGAGVAVMFATVLAATAYYDVVGPWQGFVMMAVVTAVAVVMSLKHGPFVALLGLIGGFATPTLISGDLDQNAWWATFTYLLMLEVGLTAITRKKQWFGLSALTLLASVVTAIAYTLFAFDPEHSHWLVLFVMGTAVVFVVNATPPGKPDEKKLTVMGRIWLGLGAVGTSSLLMVMLVGYSHFSMMEMSALGLLAAGALVLARFDHRYITLAYLCAGLCGLMLLAWPAAHELGDVELDPTRYYQLALGYGLLFLIGGLCCVWRNARPGMFAWLSAASGLLIVIFTHIGRSQDVPLPWWQVYTAVAVLLVICAALVWRTRSVHGTRVIDPYAIMAAALSTFALWFAMAPPWIAPAWCVLAVAVAAVGVVLKWLVIPVGWLTAGSLLLLIYPGTTRYGMPMPLVLNTMLAHYGLPALCFAAIAWVYHRDPWAWLRYVYQALGLVVAMVTISLQVRLGFHPEAMSLWRDSAELVEWSTYAALWLAVGSCVLWLFKRASLKGLRYAAIGAGVFGMVTVVLYPLLIGNPFLTPPDAADVGGLRVLNWLVYIYGLPSVLVFVFARMLPREAGVFKQIGKALAFVLLFALVTLEVRHGFTGENMAWRPSNPVVLHEWATYSVVWLLMSLAMAWVARVWRSDHVRIAAMVVCLVGMVAAVFGPVLISNPMFESAEVGSTMIVNWLLYIYGLPCVLAAVWAMYCEDKVKWIKPIAASVSLLLLFVLVSMQIRQGFAGSNLLLDITEINSAESYSYSLAWVLLALALLGSGLATGSAFLRYGSLAVMLVAVAKVAVDVAQLKDLWRVLSLLGLGLSLIVLGYIYQRYVFRRPKQAEGEPELLQEGE